MKHQILDKYHSTNNTNPIHNVNNFCKTKEQNRQQINPFSPTENCLECETCVIEGLEFCSICGAYLNTELCSFCGSLFEETDQYCTECGNPRKGIVCPDCNAISYRSFCTHCNAPLNELAFEALREASTDPIFMQMLSLANELDTLKQEPEIPTINKQLLDEYDKIRKQSNSASSLTIEITSNNISSITSDERKALYKQKMVEMQTLMDQLRPMENAVPQIQRNYYSARQLPSPAHSVLQSPCGWECNYCRCQHRYPSECVHPELGGKWIYITTK